MSYTRSIEDERIAFYFRHHTDIRRWAAIGNDVPQHVHRYLLSLQPRLATLANELEAYPYTKDLDRGHPKLLLVRRSWLRSSERARVGIGLEWRANGVDLVSEMPHAGVWVDLDLDKDRVLSASLEEAVRSDRSDLGHSSSVSWPSHKEIAPDEGNAFWQDLGPLTEKIVDRVVQAWRAFADTVDDVVDRHPR